MTLEHRRSPNRSSNLLVLFPQLVRDCHHSGFESVMQFFGLLLQLGPPTTLAQRGTLPSCLVAGSIKIRKIAPTRSGCTSRSRRSRIRSDSDLSFHLPSVPLSSDICWCNVSIRQPLFEFSQLVRRQLVQLPVGKMTIDLKCLNRSAPSSTKDRFSSIQPHGL